MTDRDRVRYVPIDILKAAAIIGVIWIHSFHRWGPPRFALQPLSHLLTAFAVPAFFFASGFLHCGPAASQGSVIMRRAKRLLVPYFVASVAALGYRHFLFHETITVAGAFFDLVTGSAWGIYYFVPLLVGAAVVLPLFARSQWVAIALFVVFSIMALACELGLVPLAPFWALRNPAWWWGYYLAGWLAATYYGRVARLGKPGRHLIGFVILGIIVIASTCTLFAPPRVWPGPYGAALRYLTIYSSIAAIVFLGFDASSRAAVRYLSEATYPIYLYHFFFTYTARQLSPYGELTTDLLALILGAVGSVTIVSLGRALLGRHARLIIG